MSITQTQEVEPSLLSTLLSEDAFWPSEPQTFEETGLVERFCGSAGAEAAVGGRHVQRPRHCRADLLAVPHH